MRLTSHVAGAWPIGRETELSCTAPWIPWAVHLSQQAGEDFLEQAWAGKLTPLGGEATYHFRVCGQDSVHHTECTREWRWPRKHHPRTLWSHARRLLLPRVQWLPPGRAELVQSCSLPASPCLLWDCHGIWADVFPACQSLPAVRLPWNGLNCVHYLPVTTAFYLDTVVTALLVYKTEYGVKEITRQLCK